MVSLRPGLVISNLTMIERKFALHLCALQVDTQCSQRTVLALDDIKQKYDLSMLRAEDEKYNYLYSPDSKKSLDAV